MTLLLTRSDVEQLLDMGELIDTVERSLVAYSTGRVIQPVRLRLWVPHHEARLLSMPAYLAEEDTFGLKITSGTASNRERGLPSVASLVLLHEVTSGRPLAVMDGVWITATRTAAASAVATRLLAAPDAATLALVGAGVQAETHLWAVKTVRPIRRVLVAGRSPDRAERFVTEQRTRFPELRIDLAESAEAAVRAADVICTVTTSGDPVVRGAWLRAGAHVNAVGAFVADRRELDSEAVGLARVVVDSREAASHEAGDILIPQNEGAFGSNHVLGELGELAAGTISVRTNADQITLFKNLGIAAEDVATAHLLYEKARAAGVGHQFDFG